LIGRDDDAVRRKGAAHLQRAPALHVLRRREGRRHERRGRQRLRRELVRGRPLRKSDRDLDEHGLLAAQEHLTWSPNSSGYWERKAVIGLRVNADVSVGQVLAE